VLSAAGTLKVNESILLPLVSENDALAWPEKCKDMGVTGVLCPGRNCWKVMKAKRFALLVDGSNYYGVLAETIRQGRKSVAILGWDLDSRVRLFGRGRPGGHAPLQRFLPEVVAHNSELHIYVLTWSFPIIFANVREPQLVLGRDPFQHPRIHFKFDRTHAPGASHHQKIVVIDDGIGFCGGMDIAGGRWDTPAHRPNDPRREGKAGPYPASHDVQAMVDGDAARALAEIARDRWHRATGEVIPSADELDLWPATVMPDMTAVNIGISRTEIEQLHLDLIAAARESIYIENQYLTSPTIIAALCRRLQEKDGPEILIVLPLKNSGWLEEHTIEVLRFRRIRQLRETDRFQRLRVCYPVVPNSDGKPVGVHSKVIIIDDRLLRVGSANLTNRSMRLDTECDLTIEAANPEQRSQILHLRNRLLAEHLGLSPDAVRGSIIQLVDSRANAPRCLRELGSDGSKTPILHPALIDPPEPVTLRYIVQTFLRRRRPASSPPLSRSQDDDRKRLA
jgi:phospholipase D1/2